MPHLPGKRLPVLRVAGAAPPHSKGKAQRAQLIKPGGVGGVARPHVGREVIGEAELVLGSAREGDRISPSVFSKEMGLFGVGTKAGKKPWFESEE